MNKLYIHDQSNLIGQFLNILTQIDSLLTCFYLVHVPVYVQNI